MYRVGGEKRPTEIDEKQLLRRVKATDWTMRITSASKRSFFNAQKKLKVPSLCEWTRGLRRYEGAAREEKNYEEGWYQECGALPSLQNY